MPTPTLARSSATARGDSGLPSPLKAHAAAADLDSSGVPAFEMVDASQQRALARPAWAEQGDDLADAHRQIEPGENGLAGIGLV